MRDPMPPAERLAVTLRFLATSISHNLCERLVDVSMIDCFRIMFGLASAIIVYFICIILTCASYIKQQPSAVCAGKTCLFIDK